MRGWWKWLCVAFVLSISPLSASPALAQPAPAPQVGAQNAGPALTAEIQAIQNLTGRINGDAFAGPLCPPPQSPNINELNARLNALRAEADQAIRRARNVERQIREHEASTDTFTQNQLAQNGWDKRDRNRFRGLNRAIDALESALQAAQARVTAAARTVRNCAPPPPRRPPVGLNPGGLPAAMAVTTPTYAPVSPLAIPDYFCSETDRSRFMFQEYFPRADAHARNAGEAINTAARLERRVDTLRYQGAPPAQIALAERARQEFQPELERMRRINDEFQQNYARIQAVPLRDCGGIGRSSWMSGGWLPEYAPDRTPRDTIPEPRQAVDLPAEPQLERVPPLTLPRSFCTENDRTNFRLQQYYPAYEAAAANRDRTRQRANEIRARRDAAQARRDAGAVAALERALADATARADAAAAEAARLAALSEQINAIPIVPCDEQDRRVGQIPSGRSDGGVLAGDVRGRREPCPPEHRPVTVGANNRVGSAARTRQRATNAVVGAVVGGLLGGGGGGGSQGPDLVRCRLGQRESTLFNDPETGIALRVGARRGRNGVVDVYAGIERSPDNGTFQAALLDDGQGRLQAPRDVGVCSLWGEWSLSVSWTRSTYQDGALVSRESGGWQRSGEFAIPGMVSSPDRPDGLWRRLGFSNASHGARQIAMQYRVSPEELASGRARLVIHVTRPSGDPVTTEPFVLAIREGPGGFVFERAPEDCPQARAPAERPLLLAHQNPVDEQLPPPVGPEGPLDRGRVIGRGLHPFQEG